MTFVGDVMASVVQGVTEVRTALGQPSVIVGGLAVLSRLSSHYRATVDLDLVDRGRDPVPHLQTLRAVGGAQAVEPAAVLLPTMRGPVKVDVLAVRQIELDRPSDDPGDRLHASSHAWAHDTATDLTIEAVRVDGHRVEVTTPVAEPGPLIAMKLQAVMNRSVQKQGTDLLDIVHLSFDRLTRPAALAQLADVEVRVAQDIGIHVDLWFVRHRLQTLRWIKAAGGDDIAMDDIDLVADLLGSAVRRS